MRPATRYGRWVVFGDGYARRLGLIEWALIKCRIKTNVTRERGRKGA